MEIEDSIVCISNASEEIVSEKDVPCLVENYESQALKYIESQEYSSALAQLKRIEDIIESISAQGGTLNSEYSISILHNIAFCHQE